MTIDQPHAAVVCARRVAETLNEALDFEPTFMSTDDKRALLLAIADDERRLAALKLKAMAASADVAEHDGARDIAAWIAPRTQAEARPLRAEQRLAQALDQRYAQVAAGMAAGGVSVEQAEVIVRGLDALPDRIGIEVLRRAEAELVDHATTYNPTELRILARRILDVVAPEIAEAEEARRLEEEEQKALEKCRLLFKPLGDGSTRISGLLPEDVAERLRTYLHAFTSPRKQQGAIGGEEDRIPYARQLGQAFCALLEHLDPAKLPEHGGDATTMVVTVPIDSLRASLGVAEAGPEQKLSASAVRRLACTANILPAVLGGKGEVLDLGRQRRLFSRAQRRAMRLRDKRCRAEGCSIPAAWAEAHHLRPWSEGGSTDLDDGVLLCSFHHHRIHDRRFGYDVLPNGDLRMFAVR
ncbi:DUF222 domain-containing protein [Nocardioides sp. MH1]|uniref:HNH endonuclease signature motif containing protein n=1 Tax=Nocardioides sp. MH1 TaxID=3242490 RepID=UPI0035229E75